MYNDAPWVHDDISSFSASLSVKVIFSCRPSPHIVSGEKIYSGSFPTKHSFKLSHLSNPIPLALRAVSVTIIAAVHW